MTDNSMIPVDINETIVAIATPPGMGGIGVVRLSGPAALRIVSELFQAKDGTRPKEWPSHTVHYGHVIDTRNREAAVVDEVLVSVMRSPRSYTREDVVEISCHGGLAVLRWVLELAVAHGARLAEPGEFTRRAFLNGRIDLTQAEAVLDTVQATHESFLRVSSRQMKGELTAELESLREDLMTVYTQLEAGVNFPDEDTDSLSSQERQNFLDAVRRRVEDLIQSGDQGRLLKDGITIVICGRPNVGKSSLLNVLLREPRAIVSPLPGTTRDTVEEWAQIGGLPFRLVDTAGILEPRDVVEEEAVRRSRLNIEQADLVLFMLDQSQVLSDEDRKLVGQIEGRQLVVVVNKCDLEARMSPDEARSLFPGSEVLWISVLQRRNLEQLRQTMVDTVLEGRPLESGRLLVSNLRHIEALRRAAAFLNAALGSLKGDLSAEFVSEDIRKAVDELDRITGRQADQDLLDRIFAAFCIGK